VNLLYILADCNQWYLALIAAFLGIIVGSFLNVMIVRIPIYLEHQYGIKSNAQTNRNKQPHVKLFDLLISRSRCTYCHKQLAWHENIPIVSYVLLHGKCSRCKQPISVRYPLVELLTSILTIVTTLVFGLSLTTSAALIMTWTLLLLAFIDIEKQLLPDNLTQPLLWLGLLVNAMAGLTNLKSALFGAILGYLSLWLVYHIFRLATGKEGLGYGDLKLLAALGAWLGWQMVPLIIVLATIVGSVVGIYKILRKKADLSSKLPLGPFLAMAGWIALIWGKEINSQYSSMVGM